MSADNGHDEGYWTAAQGFVRTNGKANGSTGERPHPTRIINSSITRWRGQDPPQILWAVDGLVPIGMVTLLTAEGGAGKSMLQQSACLLAASGDRFLGLPTMRGATAGVFAEDPEEILHLRHYRICEAFGLLFDGADDCYVMSAFGTDARLWQDGLPTAFAVELERDLAVLDNLKLLSLDNVALLFGGDESDRADVTQFMAWLNGMAYRLQTGMILSAHKSKTNDGSALRAVSGSTAWVNAARQVLELKPGTDDDPPELRVIKSNVGMPTVKIPLHWENAVLKHKVTDTLAQRAQVHSLDEAIFAAVDKAWNSGNPCSCKPQSGDDRYLPRILARQGFRAKDVHVAVLQMIDNGVLVVVPKSHRRPSGLRTTREQKARASSAQVPSEDVLTH